jgi:Fe-S oxidoreductase
MENWLILLGIIGLFLFLMRRGGAGMGCCGGGHSHGDPSEEKAEGTKLIDNS